MAEEENQRTITGEDDDDEEEKESETETDGDELEGDESEPDESAGPSKGEEAGGTLPASASANPSIAIPIPVLSPDRSSTNPNYNQDRRDGDGRGNGNGKAELVQPVSSLPLSLGESQIRAEREESMAAASRRLFQRLWTDEEEIRILRGFLEFTRRRGTTFASHQYDTGPFYEEIRQQLHLDFSKNQLIEKLRRLKKKYRNCAARMRSKGPAFSFRSPHEQAIFDIARHIWRPANKRQGQGLDSSHVDLDLAVDHPSDELDFSFSFSSFPAPSTAAHPDHHLDSDPAKPRSRSSGRRARRRFQQETFPSPPPPPPATAPPTVTAAIPVSVSPPAYHEAAAASVAATANPIPPPVVPSLSSGAAMEETIRSCLAPLFKELVSSAIGGGASSVGYSGLGPMPICPPGKSSDDKWRQQHILELEVYLQRIELVKEQVMQVLQDLKGTTT